METSKQSTGETLFDLTLYAADTPANHSAQQESAKDNKTQDIFGLGYEKPLANYDPDTQSWRMYEATYLWGDCPLLETLPASGMTQSGVLFPQPQWVRLTGVIESSSWPTPRNCTAMAATITPETTHDPKRFPNLETVVGRRQWPTPTAHPNNTNKSGKFPNPTLSDAVGGKLNPMWVEWLMGFPMGWTDLEG
jgi:hypothetical protein